MYAPCPQTIHINIKVYYLTKKEIWASVMEICQGNNYKHSPKKQCASCPEKQINQILP